MHIGKTVLPTPAFPRPTSPADPAMIDGFGRTVSYLRLSVTDRCDLRCRYCMGQDTRFVPHSEVLSLEEMARLGRIFARQGVRKIRLTGGEPLGRPNVISLIRSLGLLIGEGLLDELTLTTNGTRLASLAGDIAQAGVRRVNVSLDSLDAGKFAAITRHGRLDRVLDGIAAARDQGMAVRINTVVQGGINDGEIDALVEWCGSQGHDLCLIELMPLGPAAQFTGQAIPMEEVRRRLSGKWTLHPSRHTTGGPARYMTVAETGRHVGFIAALSDCFCAACNRVRVTSTGILHPCLAQDHGIDLRAPLRSLGTDAALETVIGRAVHGKEQRHQLQDIAFGQRSMNMTGG